MGIRIRFSLQHNLEKTWRGAAGVFHCAITHPHELHGDQLEALLLETLDDLANQSTLDGIGLDHDKSALLVSGHVDSMEKNLLLRIPIGLGLLCECYGIFDMPCRSAIIAYSGILIMPWHNVFAKMQ